MESRQVQCNFCRQRLCTPKPNESVVIVICPGCNLPTKIENYRLNKFDNSSTRNNEVISGRDKGKCPWKCLQISSYLKRRNESSPKRTSLNSKPSPLQLSRAAWPKKRAVLCGVSYNDSMYKLKGIVNDVKNMKEMLINKFEFQEGSILVLTEDEAEPEHIPTKKNIENALKWLVKDCKQGDSLVFYFSGYGLRQPDFNNDEVDGFDETICPVDFMKEGMILDNYINSTIVRPLTKDVTLHAIVDACDSGTILDLLYVYNRNTKTWENNAPPSGVNKATSGGLAICISACEDDQVASDTSAFTGKTMIGAMTYILIEVLNHNSALTYGKLLDEIEATIEEVNKSGCLINTNFLRKLFDNRITQKALLSSSEKFEVDKKRFKL